MRDLAVIAPPEHLTRTIDLLYGDTAPFQWVRESWKNAQEAGATKLRYGVEWMGVESKGIYRRYIADNGEGMDADELVDFFSKWGESGKTVGTRWDNYGVGAKLTLMPWNPLGMYVVSWQDGDGSLVHIHRAATDRGPMYALRTFDAEDGELVNVVEPYNDTDLGIDFAEIGPDWVRDEGGTVFLLVGSELSPHTVLGDPSKDEAKKSGIAQYLNSRLASTDMEISVEELSSNPEKWPKTYEEARESVKSSNSMTRAYQEHRNIEGMRYHVERRAASKGESPDLNGSSLQWWLAKKVTKGGGGYAPVDSFVGFEYGGEVYSIKMHRSALQAFGIYAKDVYQRTAILISLPHDDRRFGTTFDRSRLQWADGGEEVTFDEWADWFADPANFPEQLRAPDEPGEQSLLLENGRLAQLLSERFGERLRRTYVVLRDGARTAVTPIFHKKTKKKRGPIVNPDEMHSGGKDHSQANGKADAGPDAGKQKGTKYEAASDVPIVVKDRSPYERGDACVVWIPNKFEAVLYTQHPIVRSQVAYWQGLYPKGTEDIVERAVIDWFATDISLRIAHVESLAELYTPKEREEMLSETSLTASLLGLAKDDAILKPRIGGLIGAKALA